MVTEVSSLALSYPVQAVTAEASGDWLTEPRDTSLPLHGRLIALGGFMVLSVLTNPTASVAGAHTTESVSAPTARLCSEGIVTRPRVITWAAARKLAFDMLERVERERQIAIDDEARLAPDLT